jgi:DNA-3-methyladenine glycosylase I
LDNKKRCWWCGDSELYQLYHDREWGVPERDSDELFELLNLEGAQAGLSWITILKKRENYRKAFNDFDAQKIARYSDKKIQRLLNDPGIVRNRLKINAFIVNAQHYLQMQKNGESFSDYLWSFVGDKPIQNAWKKITDVPANTKQSDEMSKSLKKRGFKFVGPTICYAFMQSAGMVNDHLVDCFRYRKV